MSWRILPPDLSDYACYFLPYLKSRNITQDNLLAYRRCSDQQGIWHVQPSEPRGQDAIRACNEGNGKHDE